MLLALVVLATAAASAQVPAGVSLPSITTPLPQTRLSVVRPTTLSLEGPIDADTYIVGPGDVFTVSIGGSVPRQASVTVSADGRLVVPEAGSFVIAGRSLARVRMEIQAALQRRYANVTADIALASPRTFYVHVSGLVPEPGRKLVPAVARVEEALVEASGQSLYDLAQYNRDASSLGETRWPALRNVRIESRMGAVRTVDLMRYLATGELAANPYLADGDRIHVPSFEPLAEGVVVAGAVDRPGSYDARPGDTALSLIEMSSGMMAQGRIARVRRIRPGAPDADVSIAEAASLDIQPRDQVYAVPANPEAARAVATGAVRYPGLYPIVRGQTTLAQLVDMAGGLREDALPRAAYLERPVVRLDEADAQQSSAEETTLPDVSVDADLLEGLFGRQFYARQTAATPRVSLRPEEALQGQQRVLLYEGDRLVVPFDYGLIRVYGRVLGTGFVPFVEGEQAGQYVERAGGRAAGAASIYVIDAATGQLTEGEDQPVRRGDAVFVNSRPSPDTPEFANLALQERRDQREDLRDRRQARFQFVQSVVGIIGTLATLVVAYSALQ